MSEKKDRKAEMRRSGAYAEAPTGLFYVKRDGQNEIFIQLSNFRVAIISDLHKDDGASEEMQREFEIEAHLGDKTSVFRIPARKFGSLEWVAEHIGAAAMITATPSAEKKIREAAVRFSSPAYRRVYVHTGWRNHGGTNVFLHAGGAIGPNGPIAGVEVELAPALRRFHLPDPVEGEVRTDAIRASLRLLALGPDRITAPVICAVYRAPLGPADFTMWLEGKTGVFKTELAALAQQHFGRFDSRALPANFSSTANFLEEWAFSLKDTLFLIDNFRPTGSTVDRQRSEAVADRLIQAAGDAAGRGRLNKNLSARDPRPPRGLLFCTGEESPSGHSTLGRVLKIEVREGDITPTNLTALQADADKFALATSCYVRWLASRLDQVRAEMKTSVADRRTELSKDIPGAHPRTPGMIASLLFGGEMFIRFALEVGAITSLQAVELKQRFKTGLIEAAKPQAAAQREEEPVTRFFSLLRSSLSSGGAHFADREGKRPAEAEAWGWRSDEFGVWRPQGIRAGWVDIAKDELYLDDAASFKAGNAMVGDGHGIGIKATTLRRRLKSRLLRTGADEGRETLLARERLEAARREVLVLRLKDFEEIEVDG